jgi:AraC-like DNA-binding protein
MKAVLAKLPHTAEHSFKVYEFIVPYYQTPWHFHPEYELVLVTKSRGKKIIGDHISDFEEGDLCLLGPNLPHTYHNNPEYFAADSELQAESIVIHFTAESLGNGFFQIPEMNLIREVLDKASLGLQITGTTGVSVAEKLCKIITTSGVQRIILLLDILDEIAKSHDYHVLASAGMIGENTSDSVRLNTVFDFVMRNFKEKISLDDVANLVNMSDSAFCRYFYKRTQKTFFEFLNETRIGYSCRLLLDGTKSVSEIAYNSGFNNISHFNRQFRQIKGVTPTEYKKEMINRGTALDVSNRAVY